MKKDYSEYFKKYREENREYLLLYSKEYRKQNKEKIKKYKKGYNKTNTKEIQEYNNRRRENNPLRYKAYTIIRDAVRSGKIIKSDTCSKCDANTKIDGHHDDYSKPLEVVWLCRQCHVDIHIKNKGG